MVCHAASTIHLTKRVGGNYCICTYVFVGRDNLTSIVIILDNPHQRLLDSSPGRQHELCADFGIQRTSAFYPHAGT